MQPDPKHKAAESPDEMLQKEHLIDPGNEHNHLRSEEEKATPADAGKTGQQDAGSGDDSEGPKAS